ncbi:MAG: PAS domain-containing protein [Desulfobacteraceae bacterium]|nr:PAS domain-containing protein [Desulfobacteraceae bacterium]
MRYFLPIVIAIFLLQDLLSATVLKESGNPALFSAVTVVLTVVIMSFVIGRISKKVGGEIDRAILERKKAEEELQKSSAFNQSIIDSSSDCIKTLDMEGRLQFMSPGGQHLLGINDFGKYLNVSYLDFWKGSDSQTAFDALSDVQQGRLGRFQSFCPTENGTPKWWDIVISPIRNAEGKPVRLLAISRDITERRNAEVEREKLIVELKNALAKVKTLSGMLPICASCKKIRNDNGYWEDVAAYITKNSDVLFSHGLCPDCEKRHLMS